VWAIISFRYEMRMTRFTPLPYYMILYAREWQAGNSPLAILLDALATHRGCGPEGIPVAGSRMPFTPPCGLRIADPGQRIRSWPGARCTADVRGRPAAWPLLKQGTTRLFDYLLDLRSKQRGSQPWIDLQQLPALWCNKSPAASAAQPPRLGIGRYTAKSPGTPQHTRTP